MADDLNPSPVSGMNLRDFRANVVRAVMNPEDGGINPVFLQWANQSAGQQKEKKKSDFYNLILTLAITERLREIDRLIDEYTRMADWHHKECGKAHDRMNRAADRLTSINDFLESADAILENARQTGRLDRERAITLLRTRGVNADQAMGDKFLILELERQKREAIKERPKYSAQYGAAKTDASYHEDQERECRRKVEELVKRRDKILKDGYDPVEAEKKLQAVTNEYQIDVRNKAAEIERHKKEFKQNLKEKTQNKEENSFMEESQPSLTEKFSAVAAKPIAVGAPAIRVAGPAI